ncbi:hypothetical protein NDU88_003933 [Pleurodeles waltl]|uniref:Uncharacterized protein n=1 Tax=Pleurodeles waltl TaxID=8319 RepID=A0AAV7MNZ4_PLEWA|nr:hypothetical protein NDU88_002892 [Pleurodeles waltl]KAJ1194645.1 hypothetical protein NDU88_003933 [Pleurodeles waltl]
MFVRRGYRGPGRSNFAASCLFQVRAQRGYFRKLVGSGGMGDPRRHAAWRSKVAPIAEIVGDPWSQVQPTTGSRDSRRS